MMEKNARIIIERAGNGVVVRKHNANEVASNFDYLVFNFVEEVDAAVAIPSLIEFIKSHFTVPKPRKAAAEAESEDDDDPFR